MIKKFYIGDFEEIWEWKAKAIVIISVFKNKKKYWFYWTSPSPEFGGLLTFFTLSQCRSFFFISITDTPLYWLGCDWVTVVYDYDFMETKSRIPRNNPVLLNCCLCIETEAETETGRPSLLHSPLVVLLILVFEKPPKPTKIIVIIINGCRRRTTKASRSSFSATIRSQSK